jgi:hypothetical protein
MDPKNVQIVINSRDRLTPLAALITWLRNAKYTNLVILDNQSTYPPLLEYYEKLGKSVNVIKLGKNLLSKALWCWASARHVIQTPFVYTDPDVVPTEDCPHDIIEFLLKVSDALGEPYKVGLSLKIDDIPDCYSQAERVRKWEAQMWKTVIGTVDSVPIYQAGVDTTFALYPAFRPFQISGVRVGAPYLARHLPWYVDSSKPTEEDTYYKQHVARGTHTWGVDACHSPSVKRYCDNHAK